MYVNAEAVWGQGGRVGEVQPQCLTGVLQENEPPGAQEQSANFLEVTLQPHSLAKAVDRITGVRTTLAIKKQQQKN